MAIEFDSLARHWQTQSYRWGVVVAVRREPGPKKRKQILRNSQATCPALRHWRPRDGRTKQFHLHMDSLVDAVINHGWHPNILDYSMLQLSQIKLAYPKANAARLAALLKDAIADHQEQNTILFKMLKLAYQIDGEYELDDLQSINSFHDGLLADGRGLLRWALTWSDDSSFTAQAEIRKDFRAVELSACKSVHMLHRQTRLLWELWCRTTYNSPDDTHRSGITSYCCFLRRRLARIWHRSGRGWRDRWLTAILRCPIRQSI